MFRDFFRQNHTPCLGIFCEKVTHFSGTPPFTILGEYPPPPPPPPGGSGTEWVNVQVTWKASGKNKFLLLFVYVYVCVCVLSKRKNLSNQRVYI